MKRFIILMVLSLLIYTTNCKKKNGKKKEGEMHISVGNVCDEGDREGSMQCTCSYLQSDYAKEAVCWIYREKISSEHPFWESFASQPNLEKLKFNIRPDGTLLNVPTNALKYLKHLLSIEIQYGYINELPPFAFANLTTLTEISIPKNQISLLQPYALANLPNLTVINLDGNKILEIKPNCIRDVPSLKMLYINRNNLSIIHDYAFSQLHRLVDLEANSNQISILTKETFYGLKSLKYLDLRMNRLTMIGDHTFEELENLHELVLDQNNIEYISDKAFIGLKNLAKLRLSENQLKKLEGGIFLEAPNIYLLDLRMNGLEMISPEVIQPLRENLKNSSAHIWLERNQLKCDCRLSWIYELRNETENNELKLSFEQLTCITDEPEAGNNFIVQTTQKPSEEIEYDVNADSLQYDDQDLEYEDDVSSEYENEPGKPPRKKIFDIPLEKLPCPEMQRATTEMAMKSTAAFWPEASSSQSNSGHLIRFDLILLFICSIKSIF